MKTNNTSKKKILFLITKSNFGGAQRYVYDLATHLPTDRFEPIVALGGEGPLKYKLKAAGIPVHEIRGLERNISLKKELLASWNIAHLIRDIDPDVLHLNSSKAGAIGALLGRLLFVPRVVFTAHGWAFNEDRGWLSRLCFKAVHWLTVLLAHHTIAVSHALKQQLNWVGVQHKMTVVHLGRATPHYLDTREARAKLATHAPALQAYQADYWSMTIGELHPVKQHHVAIAAMAALVGELPTLRHLIIGAGELHDALAADIESRNLTKHVFLLGHLDEAAQYLKAADVFVLPSRSEALGYVLLEAAQAGVPRIASNVGGIPEIVTDGEDGCLVPSGDSDALAAALQQYYTQPELARTHGQSAQRSSSRFTIATMVRNTTKLY